MTALAGYRAAFKDNPPLALSCALSIASVLWIVLASIVEHAHGLGETAMLVCVISAYLYFAPASIAYGRRHRNATAIFVLNGFLGWTVLGWIGALVWAYINDIDERAD